MPIKKRQAGEPFDFAQAELTRCLQKMTDSADKIDIEIGLFSDFGVTPKGKNDEIRLDIKNGNGRIAANNKQCLLYAAYRFLRLCGATWVLPGAQNEFLPKIDIASCHIDLHEEAAYQHRGVCIEGAVSLKNVTDMIDWIPKYGYNSYFIQFREAHVFFARWYNHRNNNFLKKEEHSVEKSREYTGILIREIKKRGLQLHMAGHGWTCEPFGIPGLGWDAAQYPIPEETRKHLAQINGKRDIFNNIALDTNLCYSNKETRSIMIHSVLEYLQQNPGVDILHFWLSDGKNNVCECAECDKMIHSDFYVQMLNELDQCLTENGIDTKIVFLVYVDLLWAPQTLTIENQDRFILMFAPITRTYANGFVPGNNAGGLPPYHKNKLVFPESVEENVGYLQAWQRMFHGESFLFDYHMMWDHVKDFGYIKCAEVIHDDISNLGALGLNGYVSCQLQRIFLPNALPMVMLAETLWNKNRSFEEIAGQYFTEAYGKEAGKIRDYLQTVSGLYSEPLLKEKLPVPGKPEAERYEILQKIGTMMTGELKEMKNKAEPQHKKSFELLEFHARLLSMTSGVLRLYELEQQEKMLSEWTTTKMFVQQHELEFQPYFDVYEFIEIYQKFLLRQTK